MTRSKSITTEEYNQFKTFLESASGITLGAGKEYLITSRLGKLLQQQNIDSVGQLLMRLKRSHASQLSEAVIDAMTTNETSWFRDNSPFIALKNDILPMWEQQQKTHPKIWSSACSSGQEPYTISIVLSEYFSDNGNSKLKASTILATDISTKMLAEAKKAEYEEFVLRRGLSAERKQKFFTKHQDSFRVDQEIRNRVTFREQNLMSSYQQLGKFDLIFCRNVLIYFSASSKQDILARMAQALNPGGCLLLGASETITGYSDAFNLVRGSNGVFYQLKD